MTPELWHQIEDLYHAARKQDPDERAALLECTDPAIRSRVERMLALDFDGQMPDRPAPDLIAPSTETIFRAGSQLGPYKIEALIGEGGMGIVYRAMDTRLGRVVAIKIAAARYSERFRKEARAISTLNHPHICTLYDVGPEYLVMEYIEGSTLATEIKKGPMAPELVARYGAQIAGALAEAHSRDIVHRDLKPANIMLTRHGVKVVDFGLAKMLSETGLTDTSVVMGTPAYMAPEQVEGREPTGLADLFALGLVLYEMSVFLDGGFFLGPTLAAEDQVNFAPRLKKPALMINGRYDFTFSPDRAQEPMFRMLGAPAADKRRVVFDAPHDVSQNKQELSKEVLSWLDKYLARVN